LVRLAQSYVIVIATSGGLGVGCFPTETIPVPQGWLLRIGHSEVDRVHVSVHGLYVCIVEVYVPRRQGASHKVCRTARFDHRAPVDVVILTFRLWHPRGTIVFLQQPSYNKPRMTRTPGTDRNRTDNEDCAMSMSTRPGSRPRVNNGAPHLAR
jgi:hypothetical protein